MVYLDYELSQNSNRVLEKRSKYNPYHSRMLASVGGYPVLGVTALLFGTTFIGVSKY